MLLPVPCQCMGPGNSNEPVATLQPVFAPSRAGGWGEKTVLSHPRGPRHPGSPLSNAGACRSLRRLYLRTAAKLQQQATEGIWLALGVLWTHKLLKTTPSSVHAECCKLQLDMLTCSAGRALLAQNHPPSHPANLLGWWRLFDAEQLGCLCQTSSQTTGRGSCASKAWRARPTSIFVNQAPLRLLPSMPADAASLEGLAARQSGHCSWAGTGAGTFGSSCWPGGQAAGVCCVGRPWQGKSSIPSCGCSRNNAESCSQASTSCIDRGSASVQRASW